MTFETPKTPSYRRMTSTSINKKSTPLSSSRASGSSVYKKRKSSCSKMDRLCKTAWALAPARFSEGAIIGGSCHDLFVQTTNDATHSNNSATKRKKKQEQQRLSWTCSENRHHDHFKTLNHEQDATNHNIHSQRQVDEKKGKYTTRHNERIENDNQTISNHEDVPKEIHVTKLFFDAIDQVAAISIDEKQNNLASSDIENPVIVEHLLQKLHDKDLYIQKLKMVIESHEKVIEFLSRKRNNEQEANHKDVINDHIHDNDKIGIHEQTEYATSRSIQLSEEELYRLKQDIEKVHSELRLLKESLAVASASVMKNCESLKLYVNEEVKDNIKVVDEAVNAIKQELQERNK